MKKIYLLATLCAIVTASYAQKEPAKKDTLYSPVYNDTIRVGSILIIKKNKKAKGDTSTIIAVVKKTNPRKSTNYLIFDVGFANFNDNTNYANTGSFVVNKPGTPAFNTSDLKLKNSKSININIWLFMQKYALVKNNVNFKYGFGMELNNYRFRSPISFKEKGIIPYSGGQQTNTPFVFKDSISFSKNKLAADYLTVPLMLNLATTKKPGKANLSASFGVSAGYLYSQRDKQKSAERGKQKNKEIGRAHV